MTKYEVEVNKYGTFWKLNGKFHREDGPAVEYAIGTKSWYLDGKRHREDGPAIEYADGSKAWLLNDELHREDGPAFEYTNGTKYWYLNGVSLSEQEWKDQLNLTKEMTIEQIQEALGHKIKIVE